MSEAERDLLDAVAAGAAGYLLKNSPVDEVRATAHRRSSPPLAAAALATIVSGSVVGLVDAAPPIGVWLAFPAAVVTIIELSAFARERSLFGRWADGARTLTSPARTRRRRSPGVGLARFDRDR